ncbi:hypothetical protein F5I97DRAFT_1539034 [Phlebopus sp. FC_14]|nr:hypothetical protein F5I97DRAFT_1539034 [Phlebopus sp. FC_14]
MPHSNDEKGQSSPSNILCSDTSASNINVATQNVNTTGPTDGPSDGPLFHSNSELSEAQLRRLYDEEEVKRFMNVFSVYVTEVRVPGASTVSDNIQSTLSTEYENLPSPIGHDGPYPLTIPPLPPHPTERFLSERIAQTYVLPYLPLASHTSPPFTVKRLRVTAQRLYLATVPPYQAFLLDLVHLALWKDKRRSMMFCTCFWTLWFYDLLLPALMFRILWCLLRRRLLPYPSLNELQERQQDAVRARRFGEELQERLSSSIIGPKDIWTLFKSYRTSIRNRERAPWQNTSLRPELTGATGSCPDDEPIDNEPAVPENGDSEEEQDLRRDFLQLLNEVADIHERVKKPSVSQRYAYLLTVTAFGVLFLPAQYIAKLVYMFGGIIFWHVAPIIAALRPEERARIPPPFADAPTDAEYAIELITKRVASGDYSVLPASKSDSNHSSASSSAINMARASNESDVTLESQSHDNGGINWRKWGARVAHGKSWINDGKQLFSADRGTGGHKSFENVTAPHPRDVSTEETFAFPAQYAAAPGLITLTSDTIYFTSLTATRAKLVIPFTQLRRVKKIGPVKGLSVTWLPMEQERDGEREEKFYWSRKSPHRLSRQHHGLPVPDSLCSSRQTFSQRGTVASVSYGWLPPLDLNPHSKSYQNAL